MPKKIENLDEKIAEEFMTAKEAQKALGVDKDRFNYLVKMGDLKSVQLLGRYGYYRRREVEALVQKMYAFLITARHADLEYRMATLDDLDAELELTALCFGRKRAEATRENRRRFLEKNPQMFWHLYSFNQLVAAINIVPLTHDAILEFRDGKRGWLFSNEQIEQFEPGHRLECIIIDMMRTPRVPQGDENRFGMYLLLDLMQKTMPGWGRRGIDIKSVDACAGTPDGARMLEGAGFEHLGIKNGRDMWHLDLDASDLPLLHPYKNDLAKWKSEQTEDKG